MNLDDKEMTEVHYYSFTRIHVLVVICLTIIFVFFFSIILIFDYFKLLCTFQLLQTS